MDLLSCLKDCVHCHLLALTSTFRPISKLGHSPPDQLMAIADLLSSVLTLLVFSQLYIHPLIKYLYHLLRLWIAGRQNLASIDATETCFAVDEL
jgi:hypothetical protein